MYLISFRCDFILNFVNYAYSPSRGMTTGPPPNVIVPIKLVSILTSNGDLDFYQQDIDWLASQGFLDDFAIQCVIP